MPIITIKYHRRDYQREVSTDNKGMYIMVSKGKQYWFRKDPDYNKTNNGWHLVYRTSLPDDMLILISEELEKLNSSKD